MARHMMRQDMIHNDMAQNHAAVSYFWGFFWYAYFCGNSRYRLT